MVVWRMFDPVEQLDTAHARHFHVGHKSNVAKGTASYLVATDIEWPPQRRATR